MESKGMFLLSDKELTGFLCILSIFVKWIKICGYLRFSLLCICMQWIEVNFAI
jgi:cytochrome c oxidase subunit IV